MNTPTPHPPALEPDEELEALLPTYFMGQTSPEDTRRVEEALRTSPALQEAAEETLHVMDALRAMPRATATRSIREAVRAEIDAPIPLRIRLRPYAAAALFLLVAGGLVWMQSIAQPRRGQDMPPLADVRDIGGTPPPHAPAEDADHAPHVHTVAHADPSGDIRSPSTDEPRMPDADVTRDPASDAAAWLARSQRDDGSWDIEHYGGRRHLAAGVQGLALMALLQNAEEYPLQVVRAVHHLQSLQNEDGSFGGGGARMYNHGIATLALLQAYPQYALPGSDALDHSVARALAFTTRSQGADGGWGYFGHESEVANTAVSAWQILALQEARRLGLLPDDAPVLDTALAFLRRQAGDDGRVRYGAALVAQATDAIPAMTALCLMQSHDPDAQRLARAILQSHAHPARTEAGRLDPYRAWFDHQARPDSAYPFRTAVAQTQIDHGSDAGSIPAWTSDWGHVGGTVYATAMNSLAARR